MVLPFSFRSSPSNLFSKSVMAFPSGCRNCNQRSRHAAPNRFAILIERRKARKLTETASRVKLINATSPGRLAGARVAFWLSLLASHGCDRLGANGELEVDLHLVARLEAAEDRC